MPRLETGQPAPAFTLNDKPGKLAKFVEKQSLTYPLLSDADR